MKFNGTMDEAVVEMNGIIVRLYCNELYIEGDNGALICFSAHQLKRLFTAFVNIIVKRGCFVSEIVDDIVAMSENE